MTIVQRYALLPATALAAMLVLVFAPNGFAQSGVVVGVDVDPSGNTATTLGEPQFCRSVQPGSQFEIDVFVNEIPAGRTLAGFNYAINYDSQRVTLIQKQHKMLLSAGTDGSSLTDLSESTPNSDDDYGAAVVDLTGPGQAGPLPGVLGRYTLEAKAGATTGTFPITLTLVTLADAQARTGGSPEENEIQVSQILGANIAVGQACTAADSQPTSVIPTLIGGGSPPPTAPPAGSSTVPAGSATPTSKPGDSTTGPSATGSDTATPRVNGPVGDDDGFPWIPVIAVIGAGAVALGVGLLVWRRLRANG